MATTSSRALYRSRQVYHALWPRVAAADLEAAGALLTESGRRIFAGMPRRDQRHALEVLRRLSARTDDPDLLVAGLLHDCGKGDVPVSLRILHVIAPKFGEITGREGATGWRGAAYRLHHHVERSARLANEAGCSEITVRLIGGTHTPEEAWAAELLRAADDES